jgi:hypothetical protein
VCHVAEVGQEHSLALGHRQVCDEREHERAVVGGRLGARGAAQLARALVDGLDLDRPGRGPAPGVDRAVAHDARQPGADAGGARAVAVGAAPERDEGLLRHLLGELAAGAELARLQQDGPRMAAMELLEGVGAPASDVGHEGAFGAGGHGEGVTARAGDGGGRGGHAN